MIPLDFASHDHSWTMATYNTCTCPPHRCRKPGSRFCRLLLREKAVRRSRENVAAFVLRLLSEVVTP